ncbi:calcyphosin-2 isoform X1, partial [Tachysurus ichikawai]
SVRERLRGRAVQTLVALGRRLQKLDVQQNGIVGKDQLRECVMEELGLKLQEVEALWRLVGLQRELMVDYAEVMCAVTGDMNESRKAVFIKVTELKAPQTQPLSLSHFHTFTLYHFITLTHLHFNTFTL